MSVRVMTWVWDHSQAKGNERLVLLAIADHAHDDGTGAFPSQALLTQKTQLSESTVRRCIRNLETLGELVTERGRLGNRYRVCCQTGQIDRGGQIDRSDRSAVTGTGNRQEPSEELTTPTGSATPSVPDRIAAKHLEPLVATLRRGGGFDLTGMIGKAWGPAWREAEEAGIDPNAVGVKIAGFFFQYVTDEPPNWGRIGQLVKRYGKVALYGLDDAVGHADDPYRYAFRRCQQFAEEREAELARRGNE